MLIGSKNLEIYSNVVPTVHNFVLLPPSEPTLGNDNTSPICSPNGVWAAQAAFAPRVANAKFFVSSDEWDVWQCEPPVSNMKHNKFGTLDIHFRKFCRSIVGQTRMPWMAGGILKFCEQHLNRFLNFCI